MESRQNCPECHLTIEAEMPETGICVCPLCNSAFTALPADVPAPMAAPPPSDSGRQVWRGVLAVGALFFLVGGAGYAYHLLSGIDHKAAAAPAPTAHIQPAPPSPYPVEIIPAIPEEPAPQPLFKSSPPGPQPLAISKDALPKQQPRPLTMLEKRVNRAIDRGVAYLQKNHNNHPQYRNYLGLLGLTLLECGIPADDPSVQQIAALFRTQRRQITQTYELALAILFLDRLGDPRDRRLIYDFGQLLLFGQVKGGIWTYGCLRDDPKRFMPAVPVGVRADGRPVKVPANAIINIFFRGDNSNTQLALLGLWVAQRHGVPVRSALLAAEQHFRCTRLSDGSWTYNSFAVYWRDSMTCAGLMSLAMSHSVRAGQGRDIRPDQPIPVYDAAISDGLRYLARALDKITVAGNRIVGVNARDPLYFLWSLERMAVIYDLKKIGDREWYPWAAQMLVDTQFPDGRWEGMGGVVGTCFALLVLRRSNFAQDLQIAVQKRPSPPTPDISGPTILLGPDVFLGQTSKANQPASMPSTALCPGAAPPLGPSISQTPNPK